MRNGAQWSPVGSWSKVPEGCLGTKAPQKLKLFVECLNFDVLGENFFLNV